MSSHGFEPDWTSSPGATITDALQAKAVTVERFASEIGESLHEARRLIQGDIAITIDLARRLTAVVGGSVQFWMTRDFHYREDAARRRGNLDNWLAQLPIGDMIRWGWMSPRGTSKAAKAAAALDFFGERTVRSWHENYAAVHRAVKFRTSATFESRPGSVAAWLRRGELEAEAVSCSPFDKDGFARELGELRLLTRQKNPELFLPRLRERCKVHGVVVAVIKYPDGCRASGATRLLGSGKALLQLSSRHLSDDQFWFTFFHEAGHLILHRHRELIVEGFTESATEESEANEFAADVLLPKAERQEMAGLPLNPLAIIRFARRIGVAPGLVVGQMQNMGRLSPARLNRLKRRFMWKDDRLVSRETA